MIRGVGLRSVASLLAACVALAFPAVAKAADTPSFGHAAVVQRDGEPELRVDGKPFFFFGGAFFYERIPPSRWRQSMLAMRALGANTLDLYIPWNWHEPADGEFDFDGHTNPRRNLREVLRLGRELGFYFTIRPGPVIRNEWRNGGYPAWLLTRPEYAMPLHDVLEGRYPATATLQNAHGDDAAAEWLRNATHLRYASRWLHRALDEVRPVADRVLAVQLDDDQAAYSDNQTYPAPHLQAYLNWLDAQVREVVGPLTPTFINTYQTRVPAALPVWTMGNWYQSDADRIGEHDRGELDFSTLLLGTNPRGPLAVSEFQAGWLAAAENPTPRAADASNTTLALSELVALGAKGAIDFPLQDTLAPFGWEAPWSNALYAWGAAIALDGDASRLATDAGTLDRAGDRGGATARIGRTLALLGPLLAGARREADTAIVYAPEGYARPLVAEEYGALFARVREALAACRAANRDCDIVDPLATPARLARYATVVDVPAVALARSAAYARALAAYRDANRGPDRSARRDGRERRAGHGRVVPAVPFGPSADPVAITRLRAADGATIVVARNWTGAWQRMPPIVLPSGTTIPAARIAPRDALVAVGDVRLAAISPRYGPADRLTSSCTPRAPAPGSGEPPFVDAVPFLGGSAAANGGPGGEPVCAVRARIAGVTEEHQLDASSLLSARAARGRPAAPDDVLRAARNGARRPLRRDRPGRRALRAVRRGRTRARRRGAGARARTRTNANANAAVRKLDVFEDGGDTYVLQNARVRAVIVADGGGRLVSFGPIAPFYAAGDGAAARGNLTDATGALRDDVLSPLAPSPRDYIARYTHDYPAGTFNRPYRAEIVASGGARAALRLTYAMPDAPPAGATFEKTVWLGARRRPARGRRLRRVPRRRRPGAARGPALVAAGAGAAAGRPARRRRRHRARRRPLRGDRLVGAGRRRGRRLDALRRHRHPGADARAGRAAPRHVRAAGRNERRRSAGVRQGGARVGRREPGSWRERRGSGETVYAVASKATERELMWVRVPPSLVDSAARNPSRSACGRAAAPAAIRRAEGPLAS